MTTTQRWKSALDIMPGDQLTNIGVVNNVHGIGAFVAVTVSTFEWSLVTGTNRQVARDVVFHNADEVWIHAEQRD